jgi:NAD(P)-dependent dehydrogenase (short-subunit alcohol dehydrogenase family)
VIDVNVHGTWNGTRAVIPYMKEQGSGAIVNVSSLAGKIGLPNFSAYSLTKGAVLNFTRAVATELGPYGVRANAVCPGFVETALAEGYFEASGDPDRARKRMEASYPLKRLGEPEEIAEPIVFLLSERASYVTGHGFTIDGGYSAG